MWTYILRRLLAMIPTLFGVTIVSFCVMQLAPGDPLKNKLGSDGKQSQTGQTRDAYLLQKRDLKLDKPLLLNFRAFKDYEPIMRIAAYYQSLSADEIREELGHLLQGPLSEEDQARLDFLRMLKIDGFEDRFEDEKQHRLLARAVHGYLQAFCEDMGNYTVPATLELLNSPETDLQTKRGLIDCVNFMVVDRYSKSFDVGDPPKRILLTTSLWKTWLKQNEKLAKRLTPQRSAELEKDFSRLVAEPKRTRQMQILQDELFLDTADMPFFARIVVDPDQSIERRAMASSVLAAYIPRPIKMSLPHVIDSSRKVSDPEEARRPVGDEAEVNLVAGNWNLYYQWHAYELRPGMLHRLVSVVADTQYAHMVGRLATFRFGRSTEKTREWVSVKIWNAVCVSAPLMFMAEMVIYFIAVPLGILCAVNRGKFWDRLISLKLFFLYSIPPFVAGMLFLLFFCYGDYLRIFPMERLHSPGSEQFGFFRYILDYLWHAFLPVVCLSLFSLAGLAMYSRTSMLDVLSQDFIRTARAKGVSRPKVIFKHGLRNALIPIITLFSNFLPAMLGGSVIIEMLFNIQGMGFLGWNSILSIDIPVVMALIYVQAIVVLISILITDILYVIVDPRISFEGRGGSS